jgi:phospholipid/cholesterol/gamma-HCH transport system permease protein
MSQTKNALVIKEDPALLEVNFHGNVVIGSTEEIESRLIKFQGKTHNSSMAIVDLTEVTSVDTVGAWLIYKTVKNIKKHVDKVHVRGASLHVESLLKQIEANDKPFVPPPPRLNAVLTQLEDVGVATATIVTELGRFLSFIGLVTSRLLGAFKDPKRIRITPLVYQMEHVGLKALSIIGLMSFLIGAVIVNQGAIQLRQFGAEVFVVDMLAITQLRELGVLLTAIMVAGRSGSAFTAQIGSMKANQEIDAMETIGMHPIDVLVLPRLLALVLVLPVLVFYADIMGLLGGALTAWVTLDISPGAFVQRLQESVLLSTFMVGIIKAPFFAAIIALSGCFEGMSVSGSAESVGKHTTRSVVQSIFLVIVLDAFFAIFFTALDW